MVEQLLKQGIMHKLIDICVQTPSNRWAAVGVLCAVIKSENPLHKCVALRKNYTTPAIDLLLLELGDSSAEGEQQDIIPENEVSWGVRQYLHFSCVYGQFLARFYNLYISDHYSNMQCYLSRAPRRKWVVVCVCLPELSTRICLTRETILLQRCNGFEESTCRSRRGIAQESI